MNNKNLKVSRVDYSRDTEKKPIRTVNVTVTSAYMDKYTGIRHAVGERFPVPITRFRELNRNGEHVKIDTETEQEKTEK